MDGRPQEISWIVIALIYSGGAFLHFVMVGLMKRVHWIEPSFMDAILGAMIWPVIWPAYLVLIFIVMPVDSLLTTLWRRISGE